MNVTYSRLAIMLIGLFAYVRAECPNACSGHGSCSLHDQCTCCRNWQGNDCSQRTCPFGYAHVDSPKGDLDGSTGTLSGPNYPLVLGSTVYPFGTTEQYPDAASNEGHFYMECSNKGMCDRETGSCGCFPGYEGSACQRASCPNDCSGHGTCETIKELAEDREDGDLAKGAYDCSGHGTCETIKELAEDREDGDLAKGAYDCSGHGTCETIKELAEDREDGDLAKGAYAMSGFASEHAGIGDLSGIGDVTYELWDKTLTMGCKCDPGFMGPDCSLKLCRYGVDPLFIPSNYLYSADGVIEYDWDAPHFEKAFVEIVGDAGLKGQFDLTIYDVYGEKYVLDGLNYAAYESNNYTKCEEIMSYFPNEKLKDTTMGSFHHQMSHKGGLVSSAYVGGILKPFCTAMTVNNSWVEPTGFKSKFALNNAELTNGDQVGIRYEFDYNRGNPGYIKDLFIDNLTPEPTYGYDDASVNTPPVHGYYGIIKQGEVAEYSDTNKNFDPTTNRFMYSDDNFFQSGKHDVLNDYGVTLPGYIIQATNGSTKCCYIVGPESEDYVVKAHVFRPVTNLTLTTALLFPDSGPGMLDYNNITYKWTGRTYGPGSVDQWAGTVGSVTGGSYLVAYPEKVPIKAKLTQVYQYVSECSGRGTCDRETGLCSCFTGYSHDNCDTQTPVC
eukprot:CAMPEP_0171983314 /NCGR_PEP_ID=MMETSP0993-20121228/273231_1 /TAXON_ID=483369 /ORGANISM="non described non described, Strain CCMP2098" /LENGTH=667 /DNA_ID=CAMNT_0012636073 /DNA_START=59 /DNA_END=2063 /DNA_ORIENTATION=+